MGRIGAKSGAHIGKRLHEARCKYGCIIVLRVLVSKTLIALPKCLAAGSALGVLNVDAAAPKSHIFLVLNAG